MPLSSISVIKGNQTNDRDKKIKIENKNDFRILFSFLSNNIKYKKKGYSRI